MFGFLGPNGAGKSTTMRLLLDLIRPSAGSLALAIGAGTGRRSLATGIAGIGRRDLRGSATGLRHAQPAKPRPATRPWPLVHVGRE